MDIKRRHVLLGSAALAGGAALTSAQNVQAKSNRNNSYSGGSLNVKALPPGLPGKDYTPVITPGGIALPWKIIDGVKVFHMIEEPVQHEFAPGVQAECWGYNGRVHGPTIEAVEGERIRIYVTNRLPEATTVHWHGLFVPNGMDGVGGLTQRAIRPGETYKYEWTLRQNGTFMYHSHHDEMTQMGMGMMGMFIIHPRHQHNKIDRDFVIMLSEWKLEPGTSRPDPNVMSDFNLLTMNAKCFPGTPALVAKQGDKVRLRFGNLSAMDHHPIHLHGYYFKQVATDGGAIPISAQYPETTVLVPVGSTRDVEFVADAPGDWAMHCHMTHHVMNQMGHGLPNMIGMNAEGIDEKIQSILPDYMTMGHTGMGGMEDMNMVMPKNSIPMVGGHGPFDYITMGGMFTILKVREQLDSYEDPGWYNYKTGKPATFASQEDMLRDGIKI